MLVENVEPVLQNRKKISLDVILIGYRSNAYKFFMLNCEIYTKLYDKHSFFKKIQITYCQI